MRTRGFAEAREARRRTAEGWSRGEAEGTSGASNPYLSATRNAIRRVAFRMAALERAVLVSNHRGFSITVTASKRVTGVIVLAIELAGGPEHLKRSFYTVSEHADVHVACAAGVDDMCRVVDDLLFTTPAQP